MVLLRDYPGRAYFVLYLLLFSPWGWFFIASAEYRGTIGKNRKYFLAGALVDTDSVRYLTYPITGETSSIGYVYPLG